jgi:hypothetical protein
MVAFRIYEVICCGAKLYIKRGAVSIKNKNNKKKKKKKKRLTCELKLWLRIHVRFENCIYKHHQTAWMAPLCTVCVSENNYYKL